MAFRDSESTCPKCGENLLHEVNGVQYSRATSVEVRGVYDGGLFYAHTERNGGCGGAWHRWSDDDDYTRRLHDAAQWYIDQWNERAGV